MIRVQASETIGKPVQQVFDFISNPEHFPEWQSEVVTSTAASQGPLGIGFQFNEEVKMVLWKVKTACQITEFEANKRFAFTANSKPIDYVGQIEFEPVQGGTCVTLTASATMKGLWRLLGPMFGGEAKKGAVAELKKVKVILEVAP